jgi:hypothetical protein
MPLSWRKPLPTASYRDNARWPLSGVERSVRLPIIAAVGSSLRPAARGSTARNPAPALRNIPPPANDGPVDAPRATAESRLAWPVTRCHSGSHSAVHGRRLRPDLQERLCPGPFDPGYLVTHKPASCLVRPPQQRPSLQGPSIPLARRVHPCHVNNLTLSGHTGQQQSDRAP